MKKAISTALIFVSGIIVSVANAEFIWSDAVNLGPNVNSSVNDAGPSISAEGLTLYFSSNRTGPVALVAGTFGRCQSNQ